MRIVVNTPTGNVGSVLTEHLLDAGAEVVVLARDPEKVAGFAARGASVKQGSLDDEAFVAQATEGADALFWVTPPDFTATDFRARQNQFGAIGAKAVRANGIARVVNVSSVGAHTSDGNGPVNGLHDVEELFDGTGAGTLHLRAAFFFENFLMHLESIQGMGSIFMPISGSARVPMIATPDIARAAADRLLDGSWSGNNVLGLHGPADLSFDEAAAALSDGIGKPVNHVTIEEGQAREALSGMGLNDDVVEQLLELDRAIESGHIGPAEPRTHETTTPTTLVDWAREVMAPMVSAA